MIREPHIPLFLWIATALVFHAISGEGVTEVAQVLEERMDIRSFASSVRTRAMRSAEPLEVSLETDPVPEEPHEEDLEPPEEHVDTERVDEHELPQATPDPIAPKPEEKPAEKPKEKPPEPEEKKADEPKPADEAAQKLALLDNRRIAVQQNVEDENQADNPNAEFAGDHANHVKEQTQARITSTDQNDANPTPGGNFSSSDPNPGNSEENKVAQSEEKAGEKGVPPDDSGEAEKATEASQASASAKTPTQAAAAARAAAAPRPSPEVRPSTASPEVTGAPEVLAHGQGPGGVDRPKQSSQARAEQKWKPAVKSPAPTDLLGYGSSATTSRGVNLNLSRSSALAIIGADHMATLKKRAGEKRLSAHRGSFQNLGIERWRSAIENYVSTVKLGNQTALNTARVPFAAYLNQIHQRLHSIFADDFLGSLEGLPADHPLSNLDMSTHIEIALDRQDGSIVKMGVTKSSGVTMFDVGALEAVKKAAPYGVPPGSIVSSDGNVYFHWEFHRRPVYACSTYFARPFILNVGPEQAPPRVDPPRRPTSDEQPPDSRSGALPQKRPGKGA